MTDCITPPQATLASPGFSLRRSFLGAQESGTNCRLGLDRLRNCSFLDLAFRRP